MNSFFLIVMAALVSIHQYLPDDHDKHQKYFSDVREVEEQDVFPAANQTCRYLYSVLAGAGLDMALGQSGESGLGNVLMNLITSDQGFESILGMIDSPEVADKLKDKDVTPTELKGFLRRVCASDFNPMSFTLGERQAVLKFIKEEVAVLDNEKLSSLGDFKSYGSAKIYDANEEEIGLLGPSHQQWTPYNQISSQAILSLLATEDEDFFSHSGVDAVSIARMAKEVMTSNRVTGGSTITMQLLKNMFFLNGPASSIADFNEGTSQTLLRKVREWYWARPFENDMGPVIRHKQGKEKILELYLNLVNFGPRIQGIFQASQVYFQKAPKDLNIEEAAFLAGLLKAPSFYSRTSNYDEFTRPRRDDYILNRVAGICRKANQGDLGPLASPMVQDLCRLPEGGSIDADYITERKKQDLPKWETPASSVFDPSLFTLRNYLSGWINDAVAKAPFAPKGMQIKTTVNSKLQKKVFQATRNRLDEYDEKRRSLELVMPAKDDTGRQASLRFEDLGYRMIYTLDQLRTRGSNENQTLFYALSLGETGKTFYWPKDELALALNGYGVSKEQSKELLDQLRKDLTAQFSRPGQLRFLLVSASGVEAQSVSETLIPLYEDEDQRTELESSLEPTEIRDLLYTYSLARLNRYRQREFLTAALLTDTGELINQDLESVTLTQVHRDYLKRRWNRPGLFFWLREVTTTEAGTKLYALDAPRLQASVVVMDANSGAILANFSGYDPERSIFDRSLDAQRQLGSTVKPWIYYLALNRGFSLNDTLENGGISFLINDGRTLYRPRNFSAKWPNRMSLSQSLIHSQNIATFSLLKDERWQGDGHWDDNLQEVRGIFEDAGLYDEAKNRVSIMIGAQESSLVRLTRSFSFFANGHSIVDPYFVEKMVDGRGEVLHQAKVTRMPIPNQHPESVQEIQGLLADVANQGTAGSLNSFLRSLDNGAYQERCYGYNGDAARQSCLGGKTGTTNDGRDTWFVGFSKNFVIGVWVGYDENLPIRQNATGGGIALPIFKDVIEKGLEELPAIESFINPVAIPQELRSFNPMAPVPEPIDPTHFNNNPIFE